MLCPRSLRITGTASGSRHELVRRLQQATFSQRHAEKLSLEGEIDLLAFPFTEFFFWVLTKSLPSNFCFFALGKDKNVQTIHQVEVSKLEMLSVSQNVFL